MSNDVTLVIWFEIFKNQCPLGVSFDHVFIFSFLVQFLQEICIPPCDIIWRSWPHFLKPEKNVQQRFFTYKILIQILKRFSWDLETGHEFKLFPANIWIFKLFFLMVFTIKMLLVNIYGLLNLLEFQCDHFSSLFQAEYQFQISNVGGK